MLVAFIGDGGSKGVPSSKNFMGRGKGDMDRDEDSFILINSIKNWRFCNLDE